MPTAADYTWFSGTGLTYGYCFTLVKDLSRTDALAQLATQDLRSITGLRDFRSAAHDNFPWRTHNPYFIGAVDLGEWTLLVEDNGFMGVHIPTVRPLSVGTQVISHYRGVDAEDRFLWLEDGELRLDFEPLFPFRRSGSEPDGLVEVMQQVGFDLNDDEDRDFELHTEATLALAEHLTGVRLTAELLASADYLCGLAEMKR
jgi:hypothetical protein